MFGARRCAASTRSIWVGELSRPAPPLEADALLRGRLLAEIVEDLLDVGDVLLRLLQVLLETLLELGVFHSALLLARFCLR